MIPTQNCRRKEIPFYPVTDLYFNQELIRLRTKIQLKNDADLEILQYTKKNDLVAINNNYKVSMNEHSNQWRKKQTNKFAD